MGRFRGKVPHLLISQYISDFLNSIYQAKQMHNPNSKKMEVVNFVGMEDRLLALTDPRPMS